ncbi:hypothetical protein PBI_SCTP2_67 [Salicola phage SCTP-2]|nr:hypothetical protein PBI_SCTP2_67 [Salicola phage SCTP-2]
MNPRIVCAAMKLQDGTIVVGVRHFDHFMIQQIQAMNMHVTHSNTVQGFVDQFGEFYDREQAYEVAHGNNQIVRDEDVCHGSLFSENLY